MKFGKKIFFEKFECFLQNSFYQRSESLPDYVK